MPKLALSPKKALALFIAMTVVLIAQAVWWIMLVARVLGDMTEMAVELGADDAYVQRIQEEEISKQIMIGSEGIFFLTLIGIGAWLIYRALVKNEELKFHQQNFLMAVTHELKTPLASMKIYLDSLKSDKISQEKKISIIPRLKEDVNRLERQVENILEAGRFERSGYQLNKSEFDFSSMVENCLSKLNDYSHKKEIVVTKNNFQKNLIYYGDGYALTRAIDAILENSIKYNDKDIIEINTELYLKNGLIYLNIKDNGVGLEKKDTDKIFERFYRVGSELNRTNSGSGLGLYLCYEIIKAHKGNVTAASDGPGKGVEFNIQLKADKKYENNSIS